MGMSECRTRYSCGFLVFPLSVNAGKAKVRFISVLALFQCDCSYMFYFTISCGCPNAALPDVTGRALILPNLTERP